MRVGWGPLCAGMLLLGGCGPDGPQPGVPDKTVPVLAFSYQGRSLADWYALPAGAPAEDRAASALALAALEQDPEQSAARLLLLLRDPDPSVRFAAVVAAERTALPSRAAAALIAEWLGARRVPLRRQAWRALGEMGAVALPALEEGLTAESALARWGALAALGKIGAPAAALVDAVQAIAKDDPDSTVRRRAIFTLPRLGARGLDATLAYLRTGSVQLRLETAASLAQLGASAVPALAALLSDDDETVARLAAEVLADLGRSARAAVPSLVEALTRRRGVRYSAARALIEIGQPAVGPLQHLRTHADTDLMATVRQILEQIEAR